MDVLTIQWGWIGGKPKVSVIPPTPPIPVPVIAREEPRRWPGPPITLFSDDPVIVRKKREEEEIMVIL